MAAQLFISISYATAYATVALERHHLFLVFCWSHKPLNLSQMTELPLSESIRA